MNPVDDPLGAALRLAKGLPRSRSKQNQTKRSSTRSTSTSINTSRSSRSNSPKFNSHSNPSICSFCESEAAAIFISKSLSKTTIPLCLVHYYTTRSCRIDPKKVSIINPQELNTQLPYANDIFAEAFTQLQKEISTESARSFHEMFSRESDPLSILNDVHARRSRRGPGVKPPPPASAYKKPTKEGNATDGGFMKHIQKKEIDLVQMQKHRIQQEYNDRTDTNRLLAGSRAGQTKTEEINPYKRRKISTKSSWHYVLDDNFETTKKGDSASKAMIATEQLFDQKCSCGGDAVLFGNTMSRNNNNHKAEIWGTKRENDISMRYQCKTCTKIWNEEE
jgi:hypothetical protein